MTGAVNLKQATGYERGCKNLKTPRDPKSGLYKNNDPIIRTRHYLEEGETPPKGYEVEDRRFLIDRYQTLEEYEKRNDILIIRKKEIEGET